MSLIQRVWLVIILLVVLAFGSSLAISYTALHNHVEETLRLKNIDNVNALALTMTQMNKDPVVLELLLSAQFDTGHYKLISLVSTDGDVSIVRQSHKPIIGAPEWFVSLVNLNVPAATAKVQDGWRQFGTLKLASQYQFAYRTLWDSARNLLFSFIVVALLSLLLAYVIVRGIRQPLASVVDQARQIGNRQFRIVKEPRIRELRDVVKSMNRLSFSVRSMLIAEGDKLEQQQKSMRADKVTGLLNREYFINHVDSLLHRESILGSGMLAIVRVPAITKLNDSLGYAATNTLLMALSRQLKTIENSRPHTVAGRLNGSDFMLVVAGNQDTDTLARDLSQALAQTVADQPSLSALPAALTTYGPGHNRSSLLAALDTGLARAENRTDGQVEIINTNSTPRLFDSREKLHNALAHALETDALRLKRYPVVTLDGEPLHDECPSRLYLAEQWHPAATFLPWIARFDMTAAFDLRVVEAALNEARQHETPIAINLSAQTLTDPAFVEALTNRLTASDAAADRLLLDWPAAGALANRAEFAALANRLAPLGYKIGLKHVGNQPTQIAELHDLGLDHVKLDTALIRDIHKHADRRGYVHSQSILLHSLGITVIAAGVRTQHEIDALTQLGIDGVTGAGVLHG